jgi:hypothetical protein
MFRLLIGPVTCALRGDTIKGTHVLRVNEAGTFVHWYSNVFQTLISTARVHGLDFSPLPNALTLEKLKSWQNILRYYVVDTVRVDTVGRIWSNQMHISSLLHRAFRRITLTFGAGIIFFLILAHPVYKMWIIQELNRIMKKTAFWRGKNGECVPCLKYSVPIFVE